MIDWQNPKYPDLPDLRMAVFEAGEKPDDMPSLVLCHGWPELAYSWRIYSTPMALDTKRAAGKTGRLDHRLGDATVCLKTSPKP